MVSARHLNIKGKLIWQSAATTYFLYATHANILKPHVGILDWSSGFAMFGYEEKAAPYLLA